jgi:hypothetical protein
MPSSWPPGGAQSDPGCRSPPASCSCRNTPPTSIRSSRSSPSSRPPPKGRGAKLRSDLRRPRQNPRPIPALRMRRIACRIRVDPKARPSRWTTREGRSANRDEKPMEAGVEGAAPPPTSSVFSIVRDPGECCSDVISQASSCYFSTREDREKESPRAGKSTQKRVKTLRATSALCQF